MQGLGFIEILIIVGSLAGLFLLWKGIGNIVTDKEQNIIGKFATANLTPEEKARLRRNMMKIVPNR